MGLADCFEPCVECSNVILVCFDLMNGSMLGLFVIHCGGFWRIENKGFFFSLAAWRIKDDWCLWRLIWFRFYFSEFMFLFMLKIVPDLDSCLFSFFFFFISLKLIIPMLAFYNANKKYFWGKHYADVVFFFCCCFFFT